MTPEEKLALLKSGGKLLTNGVAPTMVAQTGQETVPINPNKNYGYNAQTKELTGASSATGLNLVKEAQKTVAELKGTPPVPAPELPEQPITKDKPVVDKSLTLINSNGQEMSFGDPELNRDAIKNAISSGFAISKGTPPSWLITKPDGTSEIKKKTQTELDNDAARARVEKANADLDNFETNYQNDPTLVSILTNIRKTWDSRVQDAEASAQSRTGAMQTFAYSKKGLQYSGGASSPVAGIITAEEDAGKKRVDDLLRQRDSALMEAETAYKDKLYDKYVAKVDKADKVFSESKKALEELNKLTIAETNKRDEEKKKIKNASEISDLMSEGFTSTEILQAGKYTPEELKDVTDLMKVAEKTQPGITGEWMAAKENDPEFKDMSLKEYNEWKNPGAGLDLEKKLLEIKKLEKDLTDKGVDEDPLNMLAYAQQYAATGMIPTGLPKGTFGVVAQTAKDLPKSEGTIVNKNTNVADSKTPSTEQQDYVRLRNIIKNTERLKELDALRYQGIIAGTLGKVFGSETQSKYLAIRKAIVDDMARMQSGAALTVEETAFYEDYLPGRIGEVAGFIGQDTTKKIDNFAEIMNNRLKERLDANGLSIYGYSTIKIGNREYKIGDTITNSKGEQGRINADGSITQL